MNKMNVKIILNNGKEYKIKLSVSEEDKTINDILMKYIYRKYNPNAALNINTFDLTEPTKEFNSVAINLKDISAVEYIGSPLN